MEFSSVSDWLASITLDLYTPRFEAAGYTELGQCVSLTDDDLITLGVTLSGHRRRILTHLPDVDILLRPTLPADDPVNDSDEEFSYVNLENNPLAPPSLPPKTRSAAKTTTERRKPRPVPRPRRSRVVSGSKDHEVVTDQPSAAPSSPALGASKRPVPTPRLREYSGGKSSNTSSTGSSEDFCSSENVGKSKPSCDSSEISGDMKDLVSIDSLAEQTPQTFARDSELDLIIASASEMAMFKIDAEGQTPASASDNEQENPQHPTNLENQIQSNLNEFNQAFTGNVVNPAPSSSIAEPASEAVADDQSQDVTFQDSAKKLDETLEPDDIYESIWNHSSALTEAESRSVQTDSQGVDDTPAISMPQTQENISGIGMPQTHENTSEENFPSDLDSFEFPPPPPDLSCFDPLQDKDVSFIRSAVPLEMADEDGMIYDAPPPSFLPPPLPKRAAPPVPPRGPESLNVRPTVEENDYIEGSFDEFTRQRVESGPPANRYSVPTFPPPSPPEHSEPAISENYHLLTSDPFKDSPELQPARPARLPPPVAKPRKDTDTSKSSEDETRDGSTDDNLSLSDGGEFMENADLNLINKMVDTKPATKRIPITQSPSSQRTVERSGFLYKQDSSQRLLAASWTRRWVVFNGDELRYYEDKKSMVSKRIIPVAVMRNVENEIKQNDSKPFRFKLSTVDRIYLFAADKLDDLSFWTNTLMQSIIAYQSKLRKSESRASLPNGLWMSSPDREGYIRMDGMKGKVFVAIKGDKLCYYNSKEDFNVGSPIHQIDMKLCAVKELAKNKLQLPTNYKTFVFTCDGIPECHMWKKAMEDAIAEGLSDTKVVEQVYMNEENRFCADCDAPDPSWSSINLGIIMCKRCAGIHRQLHTPPSKVRSLKLDTKVWTPTVMKLLEVIGNRRSNQFWAGRINSVNKISPESDDLARQQYIENKYHKRLFAKFHPLKDQMEALDEALCAAAQGDDVMETLSLIFSGANTTHISDRYGEPMNSLQLAKRAGKTLQAEILYLNGAEVVDKPALGRRNSDNYRRRTVCHKGYLFKTGTNQKEFLKRWCILERCALSYFADERSNTAKDTIESKEMISLSQNRADKFEYAFELSTTKSGGRVYLFAAETAEDRFEWMKRLAQSFSPSGAISRITVFTRSGYVFLRDGAAAEWQECWLQLQGKELAFFSEIKQQFDAVDLRKLIGLKRREEMSCADCFEKGFHFVLDFPGRAWYIQADAVTETEAWYQLITKLSKESGPSLKDQQLNSENIPIIVDKCIAFIAAHGSTTEGIYRLNGTHSKVNKLLADFNEDARSVHLKLEDYTVHDVANCLKRYFRNLDDPLLTQSLHNDWVKAAAMTDHESKLQYYQYHLQRMPKVNYTTLRKVILHLKSVSDFEAENKMGIVNLGSIFGPALMVLDNDETQGFRSTNQQIACVIDLIRYHEWLFEIQEKEKDIEMKIQEAQEKIKRANTVQGFGGHLQIPIYIGSKSAENSHNMKIPAAMTAEEIVNTIVNKAGLPPGKWALFEVICGDEAERVIHYEEKVLPVLMNWSHWDRAFSATGYLCVKKNFLFDQLDLVLDPTLSLFGELKYSEKKAFRKFYFEFKQAKLSYYRSAQATSPVDSWNVEDLLIYTGTEKKRSPPTKWCITFLKANQKVSRSKDTPFFGHTICCNSPEEMYRWLASMIGAQHPQGFFPPEPSEPPLLQASSSVYAGHSPQSRGFKVLPGLPSPLRKN